MFLPFFIALLIPALGRIRVLHQRDRIALRAHRFVHRSMAIAGAPPD
jgi:hypothetical protein